MWGQWLHVVNLGKLRYVRCCLLICGVSFGTSDTNLWGTSVYAWATRSSISMSRHAVVPSKIKYYKQLNFGDEVEVGRPFE
jgi:hypothetical protein